MSNSMDQKNSQLGQILTDMGRVMVAFSGGVDSSFLLKRAQQELGDDVLAVVVASELFRQEEFDGAVELAEKMGVRVLKTEMKELDNPAIVANTPDSWYHSKKMLYVRLNELAEELGYPYVLDGMIMDDMDDFRPGLKARTEEGARSVLQEVGLYKNEIRELSKQLEVPVWNKPASCSLASRFPYGTEINRQKINQVNEAELFLIKLGFDMVRVRYHENVARIEVTEDSIVDLLNQREQIQLKLVSLGFDYVSVDLKGYRTGSMNEVLPKEQLETEVG
ncbi:ATP-dependent sacrificial sulfur transferase LarE [Oceanobacillus profundus]|uniref:ATP-dependent sacrificial sulfur transferase LarE n=1 Tax=Oceanobacillus profundus TaxID=372463 RepID=A0A417YD93_9BACI|nr:ATP-dependent sacrificial sulfur transferase LarE [Oceanobacillus profundus]MBR3117825.1 ATP-dependent sacrificial sulfur transferase LarE [Oceanobacillus sp.]PAE28979.1 TIGR00268 family protein [Paenibacillus sp. 7884-2]MCM3397439.1 ATP-dependent sacrificial sulfur transferase LarE [Oceanobacillus profundus]MDO6448676.1 ATP-dependent sacrificial sulfur transferase LarE [Oceanobacillus profundus]RHW30601.1 ATP-dependent sacrificial sulfur transferase LarE [Oceanobacillus profundus]